MASKATGTYGHWGEFSALAQLPNVAGATVQSANLSVGDVAVVAGALYLCTTATPGGAVWAPAGGGAAPTIYAIEDFTASDYYAAAANALPGAAAFTAQAAVRIWGTPATFETIFTSIDINTPADGGWYIGLNGFRFLAGAVRDSDGTLIANTVTGNFADYAGHLQGVLHILTLTVSGTESIFYVDGQPVFTGALTGGFRVSDPAIAPLFGRNTNAFNETEALTTGLVAAGYVASALTPQQVLDQYLQTANDQVYVDPGWSNMWIAGADPAVLNDQVGAVNFSRVGSGTTSTEYRLRF